MNKPQVTTIGGLSGLGVPLQGMLKIFDGYSVCQFNEAITSASISDVIIVFLSFIASIWAIFYNENDG